MRPRSLRRLAAGLALLVPASACKKESTTACATVGRAGGVVQSYDTVLTLALQAEALDESQEFCITPTDAPPEIFGDAYIVDPPLRLNYDAQVSFRGALPDDSGKATIGRIAERDFASGHGKWVSLSGCRVEADARAVQCTDTEVSKFYGLLDRFVGDPSDTLASDTSDSADPTTDATMTTVSPETTDDTGPQPIDYPPECDSLFRGPYDLISAGTLFESVNEGGAEDLAPDGHGGFIGRSGANLVRLDVTGGTLGTPDDPGFVVSELLESPTFGGRTLGLRYAASGDLILAQLDEMQIRAMAPDGSLRTLVPGVAFPNGIYVDANDIVYYTDFLANSVRRFDLATRPADPVEIAVIPEANGVYFDPRRNLAFAVSYTNGDLFRIPIAADGTAGATSMVVNLGGAIDGLNMDVCGNLYAFDNNNGGPGRLLRVFMDDLGTSSEVEEIFTGLDGALANALWGLGDAYGDFQTALFLTGVPGGLYYVDLQITGAPAPVLGAAPPTVDDGGTSGGSSSG